MSGKRKRKVIVADQRRRILARDGFRCHYCGITQEELSDVPRYVGGPETLHIDHVLPHVHGGADDDWNLVAACPRCNLSKQHYGFDLDVLGLRLLKDVAA